MFSRSVTTTTTARTSPFQEQQLIKYVVADDLPKLQTDATQLTDSQLNNVIDAYNNNLLHLAISSGNKKMIEYLLLRKVDVNAKNVFGQSALQNAMNKKDEEIIKLILKHEIDKYESPFIARLTTENAQLKKLNAQLSEANNVISSKYDEVNTSNKRLRESCAELEVKMTKLRKTVSTLIEGHNKN